MADERWFLYVLRCRGERFYCGIAKDVDARFAEHVAGRGAKFTRAFPPQAILTTQSFDSRSDALRSEAGFKRLTKAAKVAWINEHLGTQHDPGNGPSA